jgi:hypothetical protein
LSSLSLESGSIQVSTGPVSVSINPCIFRHDLRKKRQIVRPTIENHGILPGFGLFYDRLISLGTAPWGGGGLWEETWSGSCAEDRLGADAEEGGGAAKTEICTGFVRH